MSDVAAKPFSAEDFRSRVATATHPHGADAYGDHRINPDLRDLIVRPGLRDAAVLVPIVDHDDGATVILTQRNANMRTYSGQIAFPGGRIDPEDASPEAAALREAEEEIGLDPARVEVIGRFPDYVSGTGYRVAPVLSLVRPGFELKLNPAEVDSAFEVPLAFLMDPANHMRNSKVWNERRRYFYEMPFGERYIWGMTAGILRAIYERLYA